MLYLIPRCIDTYSSNPKLTAQRSNKKLVQSIDINYMIYKNYKNYETIRSLTEFGRVFVYLKCEVIGYWYIVAICQNQFIIFIHARSTTVAVYSSKNYLLKTSEKKKKIGILSIVSGSKNSKLDIF